MRPRCLPAQIDFGLIGCTVCRAPSSRTGDSAEPERLRVRKLARCGELTKRLRRNSTSGYRNTDPEPRSPEPWTYVQNICKRRSPASSLDRVTAAFDQQHRTNREKKGNRRRIARVSQASLDAMMGALHPHLLKAVTLPDQFMGTIPALHLASPRVTPSSMLPADINRPINHRRPRSSPTHIGRFFHVSSCDPFVWHFTFMWSDFGKREMEAYGDHGVEGFGFCKRRLPPSIERLSSDHMGVELLTITPQNYANCIQDFKPFVSCPLLKEACSILGFAQGCDECSMRPLLKCKVSYSKENKTPFDVSTVTCSLT
eukprot:Gb_40753 [translate_table: standard]